MSDFVEVTIAPFLSKPGGYFEDLRDRIIEKGAGILKRAEQASIRRRWYRLGRTLRSLEEQTETKHDRASYSLSPTAAHAPFGEYGTGRRGAATGRPAPRGWKYGKKPGMAARRYSRIAVAQARPKIISVAQGQAQVFARNVTVR